MSTTRLTEFMRTRQALPVLTFIASSFGGAAFCVGIGAFGKWTLGGQSATPTPNGFAALALIGAVIGMGLGSVSAAFVALFVRPASPRPIHFQIAILLGFAAGLVGTAIFLPLCIHLPIELRQR